MSPPVKTAAATGGPDEQPETLPPLPTLQQLPPELMAPGGDPEALKDELVYMIRAWLENRPRSLQKVIGPSGIGTPCPRKLGHLLAEHPAVDDRPPGWLPGIGVAVHSMLERVMLRWNQITDPERFMVETRVSIGTVGGREVRGTADLYDRISQTVLDWKIVGKGTLTSARRHGASEVYRRQAHCYGLGFENAGLPVDRVGVVYLPRNSELQDTILWTEPYDRRLALDALSRADAIATAINLVGPQQVIPQLDRTDDCRFCEFRNLDARQDDVSTGCPGADDRRLSVAEQILGPS